MPLLSPDNAPAVSSLPPLPPLPGIGAAASSSTPGVGGIPQPFSQMQAPALPPAGGLDMSKMVQQQQPLRDYALASVIPQIAQQMSQQVPADQRGMAFPALAMALSQRAGIDPQQTLYNLMYSGMNPYQGIASALPPSPTPPTQGVTTSVPAATTKTALNPSPSTDPSKAALSVIQPDTSSHTAFVQSLLPVAQQWEQQTGIPASIWLAMAVSESNWGAAGNALFGVKGTGNAGSLNSPTWEDVNGQRVNTTDNFATYQTPNDAFQGFWTFLQQPRYQDAMSYLKSTGDAPGFLQKMNAAGYATNPDWWKSILDIAQTTINPMIQQ